MRAEMSTLMSAFALPGNAGLRPASEAGETPAFPGKRPRDEKTQAGLSVGAPCQPCCQSGRRWKKGSLPRRLRIGQEDGGRYELTERSGSLTDGRGYGVMRAWRNLRPHTDEQP